MRNDCLDNRKVPSFIALVALLFTALLWCSGTGCANYGKIRAVGSGEGITIEGLMDNWEHYDVSYAGLAVDNPSAVMFDAKLGGQKLIYDKWVPVTDHAELVVLVKWLDANVNFPPVLSKILSPDNNLYGFLYSSWTNLVTKVVDDKTMWVDDLPLPPIDYGGPSYQGGK